MLPATFQQLTPHLAPFSRGIVKNLFLIAQALLTSRSSNMNTVKDRLGTLLGKANRQPASHYKRLIRFFNTSQPHQLTKAILRCTVTLLSGRVRYLILDATTWRLGQKNVHLLVLSFIFQGVAIPILWRDLDKKGHSNSRERQSFMEEAAQLYNLKGKILLADREYTGQLWFTFLHQQGIDFVIRLQRESYKHNTVKSYRSLERKALCRKRAVWTWLNWPDCQLKLVMCRNEDPRPPKDPRKRAEPVFYWLTSLDNAQAVPAHYRKRWRIEQCFKALKTNGFNLESMNFKQSAKIELLLAVVVLAYVLSVEAGEGVSDEIGIKTYRNGNSSPAQSLFKKGLEVLNATLLVFDQFMGYLLGIFKLAKPRRFRFVQ